MTDTKEHEEPTMEEILSSIRKIINEEDDQAGSAASEATKASPRGEEDPAGTKSESESGAGEEILELTEFADEPDAEKAGATESDSLISEDAVSRTHQSFAELSALMVAGYEGADNTLEGLVRELLKPMLKAYLDENLPRIAEELVAREIARISRGG